MRRWTYREYRMRLAWLDEQWNRPSRTDNYLMQIAAYISLLPSMFFGKRNLKLVLDRFLIAFKTGKEKKSEPKVHKTREQHTKEAKARWFAWLNINEGKDGR